MRALYFLAGKTQVISSDPVFEGKSLGPGDQMKYNFHGLW